MNKFMSAAEKKLFKDVSEKMKRKCGHLVAEYIAEHRGEPGVENLLKCYEKADGDGFALLSKFLAKRFKFACDDKFQNPGFVIPIVGAMDFIVVCDCSSMEVSIRKDNVTRRDAE